MKGKQIAAHVLLGIIIAAVTYLLLNGISDVAAWRKKEELQAIHQQEVKSAIRELDAEKNAKKKAEERQVFLSARKVELISLTRELREVNARKDEALEELNDIRRPRLIRFSSRAKRAAKEAAQLQIIEQSEMRAASLGKRIEKCQMAIDSLSSSPIP